MLMVLVPICTILFVGVNNLLRYPGNIATLGLSRRMVRRAMSRALSNFITRYRVALRSPGCFDAKDLFGSEPYQQLHLAITGSWAQRYSIFVGVNPRFILATVMIPLFAGAFNLVSCRDLPSELTDD